jgi:hypothetical protein
MATSMPMEMAAYSIDTIKVMVIELTIPNKAVCHEKYLKVGLKLGALANPRAKQARLTPK